MEPLKNQYNQTYIIRLGEAISKVYPSFEKGDFVSNVIDRTWEEKELKERMRHISATLGEFLPKKYKESIEILKKAAHQFDGFIAMFFPDFVEVYGKDELEISLNALEYFTQFSSSEFAIRSFIIRYPKETMERMLVWSKHENHHVRRLASEGCRPRLPWAIALEDYKKDPTPVLQILENLKNDESEYVRRSVANNLNDIAKDNPDIVIAIGEKWIGNTMETNKLVKHACRTLLKNANPKALKLFGFGDVDQIKINNLELSTCRLKIGEDLYFDFEMENQNMGDTKIRLEYGIDYVKANGKQNRKIFQIKELSYQKGSFTISRKQSFQNFSTRKHYAGKHAIAIIVNGQELATQEFDLIVN